MIRDRRPGSALELDDLVLPMPGAHNALNATAAIAVAHELGVSPDAIRKALAGFGGVKRRFTRTGEWNGVTVFDDYGHHPVEIAAVLKAARASTGRAGHRRRAAAPLHAPVLAVRPVLHLLQRCRCGHRRAGLCGGRAADPGRRPRRSGRRASRPAATATRWRSRSREDLAGLVKGLAKPGDYVICLGAGNITQWAYALPGELEALGEKAA